MFLNLKFQVLKNQIDVVQKVSYIHNFLPNDSTSFLSMQMMGSLRGWRLGLSLLSRWWMAKVMETLTLMGIGS